MFVLDKFTQELTQKLRYAIKGHLKLKRSWECGWRLRGLLERWRCCRGTAEGEMVERET